MNYDTHNLDEATYLVMQGYNFTVTRTGPVSALFSFERGEHLNAACAEFWKGEVSVPLHHWLATRAALKNECKGQAGSVKHVASPSLVPEGHETWTAIPRSAPYWFYKDGKIYRATVGKQSRHKSRFDEGNFYPSRQDAQSKRNARQAGAIEVTPHRLPA